MKPKPCPLEWRIAYALNRAAEQRRGAQKWPDMRRACIEGAKGMLEHARAMRKSGRLERRLPA
jgi:hypothetical protein